MLLLTEMIFMATEGQIYLKEFERWLYAQSDLLERMDDDLVLTVFSFNYNQDDARYKFRNAILEHFGLDAFLLLKVKANLRSLIKNDPTTIRILYDFEMLGCRDYQRLCDIGFYRYHFEEPEYSYQTDEETLEAIRTHSQKLLDEIIRKEKEIPGFTLKDLD